MSKTNASLKKTIKEIKRLADGSIDDQIKSSKLLRKKILPYGKPNPEVNESVIREFLPTIIKFMESNDHVLQDAGANFVISISNTPDEKANTKLVIDAGVIPTLKNLMPSTNTDVLISTLMAFICIALYFPDTVIENEILQPMIQYLKSENKEVSYKAAWYMCKISYESNERVAAIFEADGVKPLVKILESKNDDAIECALESFIHITYCNEQYCQRVLDLGCLKYLKKLCDRLYYLRTLKDNKKVKLLVIRLIRNITFYGEDKVNLIINDNFIPIILQQIKAGMTPEIKIESIKVMENIIDAKPDVVPALVQDYNILPFFYSNLGSSNVDLLITTLTAMCNIVEKFEDRDIIRQKIREFDCPTKLTNLFKHRNEEIRHLSTMLYEFVFDIKPDLIAEVSGENNQQEPEVIELDSEDDDTPVIETPQTRLRKRQANTQPAGRLRRSKRFRVSHEPTDTDNTDSSSDDGGNGENDQNNDFDDHPINSSTAGAAPTESNRHDHSGRQSFVDENTVATDDEPSRLNPKIEAPSTLPDVDMPATSASRQLPDLPVASASTMNETTQHEMKSSIVGPFDNRSRLSSHNSQVVPEAASTNNENIRLTPKAEAPSTPPNVDIPATPASRQSLVLPVAASSMNETDQIEMKTSSGGHSGNPSRISSNNSHVKPEASSTRNDGNIRNGINPGKRLPIDADFGNPLSRSTSAIASALPAASTSANNETMRNNIPSRKPSPVPKPVITLTLANQVTPPPAPAAAANYDIIQDEIIKYWNPHGSIIDQYCENLGIQFSCDNYDEFISKIKFTQITSISKPDKCFMANDKSGFGCFSILLTGNEGDADKIRDQINKKFIDNLETFDKEKIKDVTFSSIMFTEHFQTIAAWLKCRILVYCNGWKKYGCWETENPMIPIFVLDKNENGFQIILDLKNNV